MSQFEEADAAMSDEERQAGVNALGEIIDSISGEPI